MPGYLGPVTSDPTPADAVEAARALLAEARRVTVLTGAGISTDSGIPDFRGPAGLWTRDPEAEKASNLGYYTRLREVRVTNWARRVSGELWAGREPNAGHRALVDLERTGRLHTLVTQNVDELHQRAGTSPELVVEIHGTTRRAMCLSCDWRDDIEVVLDRVRAGEEDPACTCCGGILKSATISFGQSLVEADLDRSFDAAAGCDVLLAIGTTLAVQPVARMVPIAATGGASVVIVNAEPTEYDALAAVVVRGSISDVLPRIVAVPPVVG